MPEPTLQRVHTTPAPDPLPPTWERTIASSIATELRRGWKRHTKKSTMHPTGAPRGHTYSSAAPAELPKHLPNTYTEHEEIYAWALIEPTEDVPWLAWHLTQLDLAHALGKANLLQHHEAVQHWLRRRPGPPPALYVQRPNRHGNLKHRRNADPHVIDTFHVAARTATIWVLDPLDVADELAEGGISLSELMRVLSSPKQPVRHDMNGVGA